LISWLGKPAGGVVREQAANIPFYLGDG
jgi:hypothetical protein